MSVPSTLYKYREFNEFTLMSLINHAAWFSSPVGLNDPFDCQLSFDKRVPSIDEYRSEIEKATKKLSMQLGKPVSLELPPESFSGSYFSDDYKLNIVDFKSQVENHAANVGVLSLSSAFSNTTMWSHYANSHTGICIGYNMLELSQRYDLQKFLFEVKYLPAEKIIVNPYLQYAQCCCGNDPSGFENVVKDIVSIKSDDWDYENEWRLINLASGNFDLGDNVINSIYFGLKSTADTKITISNILKYQKVKFYQMVRGDNGLTLVPEEMDLDSKHWHVSPE